ncbi:MAG: hypothetical protein ACQESC_03610, partial [Nanobdellota archaeon]
MKKPDIKKLTPAFAKLFAVSALLIAGSYSSNAQNNPNMSSQRGPVTVQTMENNNFLPPDDSLINVSSGIYTINGHDFETNDSTTAIFENTAQSRSLDYVVIGNQDLDTTSGQSSSLGASNAYFSLDDYATDAQAHDNISSTLDDMYTSTYHFAIEAPEGSQAVVRSTETNNPIASTT